MDVFFTFIQGNPFFFIRLTWVKLTKTKFKKEQQIIRCLRIPIYSKTRVAGLTDYSRFGNSADTSLYAGLTQKGRMEGEVSK